MKLSTFLFATMIALVLAACGNDSPGNSSSTDTTAVPSTTTTEVSGAQNPSAQAATGVKVNPPHGEPGHRCDVAVGAPLDGSPAPAATPATPGEITPIQNPTLQNQAQPAATATPQSTTTTPANNTAVAEGMNPPHGQPGHRCDIPVGAPLNSKAKQ